MQIKGLRQRGAWEHTVEHYRVCVSDGGLSNVWRRGGMIRRLGIRVPHDVTLLVRPILSSWLPRLSRRSPPGQ